MTKTFKLPREAFNSILEYYKYKLGILKLDGYEVLMKVGNFLHSFFDLGKILMIKRYNPDFPSFIAYIGISKSEKIKAFGLDFQERNIALSKMYGEFIERSCLYEAPKNQVFQNISLSDLRSIFNAKFSYDYNKTSDLQREMFPALRIDENKKIECTLVTDLVTNKKLFFPKQAIFYKNEDDDESFQIYPRNSNGGAGGFTVLSATISGIYELIEREAFLLHWLTKTPGKHILMKDCPDKEILMLIERLERYGIKTDFFDITSDLELPTILCIFEDIHSKERKVSLSASSSVSYREAIMGAMKEAYQLINAFKEDTKWDEYIFDPKKAFIDNEMVVEKRQTLLYKDNVKEIGFMFKGEKVKYSELKSNFNLELSQEECLKEVLEHLKYKIKDVSVYRYKSNNPILPKISYNVVKVIIPQLLPFYLDEVEAMVYSDRIKHFLAHKNLSEDYVLNPFPHPFP